jgi:selenocysteine-specific elongation factor
MLALPGRVRPTETLDARLRLAPDARPVKQNDRLELFVGAAESLCRVTLLDREVLEPGEAGWVQLRLDRPIAAAGGDRFILRQPSPSQTVGGGRIADPHPARHRRFRPEVLASLDALARGTPSDLLLRTLADRQPHAEVAVRTASGLTDALADQALHELTETGQLVSLSGRFFITAEGWAALREKLAGALAGYHRRYPLRSWMPREELRSRLKLAGEACDAVLAAAEDLVVVAETGVRRADHTPALPPEQERLARRWLDAVRQAPYSPPPPELEPEVVGLLLDQGHVTRVAPDVLFASDAYAEMVGWVKGQLAAGGVTVAQFRDRFGSSRKYALALLEHLDERRVTRRVGDVRVEY